MLVAKHCIETKATREAIWALWKDVAHWNSWSKGLEYTTIDGPFEKGATGTLKPKGGPKVKMIFSEVSPMKSFTSESKLFLAKIKVSHSLEKIEDNKIIVSHQVEMTGPLAFFFAFVMGRDMKKNLPRDMQNFVNLAAGKKILP